MWRWEMIDWMPEIWGTDVSEWAWWNSETCIHIIQRTIPIEYKILWFLLGVILTYILVKRGDGK